MKEMVNVWMNGGLYFFYLDQGSLVIQSLLSLL